MLFLFTNPTMSEASGWSSSSITWITSWTRFFLFICEQAGSGGRAIFRLKGRMRRDREGSDEGRVMTDPSTSCEDSILSPSFILPSCRSLKLRSTRLYGGVSTIPSSWEQPAATSQENSGDSPTPSSAFRLPVAPLSMCLDIEVDLCNATFVSGKSNSLEAWTSCKLYTLPSARRVI